MRHGGRILIDFLRARDVSRVFHVPGESFLAALDALHDAGIDLVTARQEGGAAMMAEAHAKLTGEPGVAFVTRGPGAANAAAGVHVAMQDGTPMLLFVGDVARAQAGRRAFQEVDFAAMWGALAKHVETCRETARLPEVAARAWNAATSGRPGPAVVTLPEDMLAAEADAPDLAPARAIPPAAGTMPDAVDAFAARAERPLVIVGGGGMTEEASEALGLWAAHRDLPVAAAFRRQDHLDNRHPCYAGDLGTGMNPALARRLRGADALILLGAELGEIETSGYALVRPEAPPRIAQVHPGPSERGRLWPADPFCAIHPSCLLPHMPKGGGPGPRAAAAHAEWKEWREGGASPGALRLENAIRHLSDALPEDAIVTNGAGNYAAWLHRHFVWKRPGTQGAPASGSMGYGLPAAIAAALIHPAREVVALAGDGCFQMTSQELATAAQHGAGLVLIVVDNGRYGTIRMHQEMRYPARRAGTDLRNPDFVALARAHGGEGWRVEADGAFPEALEGARATARAGRVGLIHLIQDPEALTTSRTLSEVRGG
ncbi:acetolactate synthase-1/2/3 large subunit [Hasllibacter halocynthiae]|uniref:Acetolactate synthase-1/2/3 large subunit n=1 Tax=Hasllibacter halocynthiae TaxID=595589 RepID=A0A2T0X368_9RHOB|nr:thiamine pyrophosphate-dependent enzyme [Hasllibacter halocynthiae]PRY93396.1 acetolactate synthase-1/2/3 large subunit [Hasllibacter halocynthiae]